MCVISELKTKQGIQGEIDRYLSTQFDGKTSVYMR